MEAVLTNGVDDISFLGRKGSRINIYVYIPICTEILFQLINEDSKFLFVFLSQMKNVNQINYKLKKKSDIH